MVSGEGTGDQAGSGLVPHAALAFMNGIKFGLFARAPAALSGLKAPVPGIANKALNCAAVKLGGAPAVAEGVNVAGVVLCAGTGAAAEALRGKGGEVGFSYLTIKKAFGS